MTATRRRVAVGAVAALVGASLLAAACTAGSEQESADDFAAGLAEALTSGALAETRFTGVPPAQATRMWDRVVDGMGGSRLEVAVSETVPPEDGTSEQRSSVTLTYSWALAGAERAWSYDSTVPLVRQPDGGWAARLTPSVVEPSLRRDEVLALSTLEPTRGEVIGADSAPLVTDRPVVRFGLDKTQVTAPRQSASARRLAALLGIDSGGYVDLVEAAGDEAFVEAIVLRPEDVTARVRRGYRQVRGAVAIPDELPLAPTREFARPILGTVGAVTAEIVEESDGAYEAGDVAGLSGLQERYDAMLRGEPGVVVEAVDPEGDERRTVFREAPREGGSLRVTLDLETQRLAERLLDDVRPASAIVAIRPSDGHVLAAASGPGSAGYSTATIGTYAPGSTFKVVTTLALLRAGLGPDSLVPCTSTRVVEGRSFENYDDYPPDGLGDIALAAALANSCNTAFISQRNRLDERGLTGAAASLGLGVDRDLGYPVYLGSVPEPTSATARAAAMIGQGEVLASPVAMATVAASVAAGETVVPRLVLDPAPDAAELEPPAGALTPREGEIMREMMAGVVADGSADFLADVPGAPVLAKTGTAEFGDREPLRTHAWMIAARGDLAVAVFVEVGESGSGTAGPILEEFLRGVG